MKKLLIPIAGLFFTSFAWAGGPADQGPIQPEPYVVDSGPYVGIHGGASFPNSDFLNTGFTVGAQFGYRFTRNIRIEGAFTYLSNEIDFNNHFNHFNHNDWNLDAYLGMVNAIYDLHLTPVIDPFIGFGIGAIHFTINNNFNNHFDNGGDTQFAYQAIAGLGFNVMENAMLSVRYRFVGTTNSDNNNHNHNNNDNLYYNLVEGSFDYFF